MSYWGFVKRIFCTKVASFSKYFNSILNNLSIFLMTFPTGVNLPTSSAPSIFSTLKVASHVPAVVNGGVEDDLSLCTLTQF